MWAECWKILLRHSWNITLPTLEKVKVSTTNQWIFKNLILTKWTTYKRTNVQHSGQSSSTAVESSLTVTGNQLTPKLFSSSKINVPQRRGCFTWIIRIVSVLTITNASIFILFDRHLGCRCGNFWSTVRRERLKTPVPFYLNKVKCNSSHVTDFFTKSSAVQQKP